jgi:hypothetical protein
MLKEFLEYISAQAVRAHVGQVVKPTAEPGHVYYLTGPNGSLTRVVAEPEPRHHVLLSLDSLLGLAQGLVGSCPVSLWYSRFGVTLVIDDRARRDLAQLELALSGPFRFLQELEAKGPWHSQADLVRLLRTTFHDALANCPALVEALKRVKFRVGKDTDVSVSGSRTSVSRSLEADVCGVAALPEYVTLDVPVWANALPQVRGTVRCALSANAETERFQLLPLPGELERALEHAEDVLHQLIADRGLDGAPAYCGRP